MDIADLIAQQVVRLEHIVDADEILAPLSGMRSAGGASAIRFTMTTPRTWVPQVAHVQRTNQ